MEISPQPVMYHDVLTVSVKEVFIFTGGLLDQLAGRMPGTDTRIMVNATLILLDSGGNLPERFDTLAKTIQDAKASSVEN